MKQSSRHRCIISLGSNHSANLYIPYALERLRQCLYIERESEVMQTEPVNFPYPSGWFTNVILEGTYRGTKAELIKLLDALEAYAGRDRTKPELVALDADLIVWDDAVLKPRDLERPYFKAYLEKQKYERNI